MIGEGGKNMPRFFEKIDEFYGDHSKNEKGQTLEQFLEEYDPYRYKSPCVTADVLVFRKLETGEDAVLLIKRRNHPCIGFWALPGGFAEIHEDLKASAQRELREETGVEDIPMEQLFTWGEEKRDPRGRIITTSFLAYLEEDKTVSAGDDAKDAAWFQIKVTKKQTIEEKTEKGIREKIQYELCLFHESNSLYAQVEWSQNKDQIMKEVEYKVIQSDHIAFDHARIIVHGYMELLKRKGKLEC